MNNSANPNGKIGLVFTYEGSTIDSYEKFINNFYITLPNGNGVSLGDNQNYGGSSGKNITLGTSHKMSKAKADILEFLPTNTGNAQQTENLKEAFTTWADNKKISEVSGLYLDNYTGGRIYISSCDLKLKNGEPSPVTPNDPAYNGVYGIIEPYIAAQIGSQTNPGNLVDITDIDWFSFPISIKVWSFDFTNNKAQLVCKNNTDTDHNSLYGGNGKEIIEALEIDRDKGQITNYYPSQSYPYKPLSTEQSTTPLRLCSPTIAAGSDYYATPSQERYPYHYFDDYLLYIAKQQNEEEYSFILNGEFSGVGVSPSENLKKKQSFYFKVDFRNIKIEEGCKISKKSYIELRGHTDYIGSPSHPITLQVPWAHNDPTWVTLSHPAGIYGANTGYTYIDTDKKIDYKSLQNDAFGWVVADILAALNAGFICSPVKLNGKEEIGKTPDKWFDKKEGPYAKGYWGGKAWEGTSHTNFWNTWAYNLKDKTDAYGFAFTDRFSEGVLADFNPPSSSPKGLQPVLVEIIVGDSPYLANAMKAK